MLGKTVLITGANQGIGKATAIQLARLGAKVVLWCRNEQKGRAALEEVRVAAKGDAPELMVADLASLADVRRAAVEFRQRHSRLDVLVNNAGLLVPSFHTTSDGIEETFAVNHLAPFVLTDELLPLIKATAKAEGSARIVNVASRAHVRGKLHWDDLELRGGYGGLKAYSQSKLANIVFTYELARRLEGTNVTANCLHPGVISSGFGQTYKGTFSVLVRLAKPFMATPEEGAKTSVYLASSPDVAKVTGRYFAKCKATRSNAESYDEASWTRLWEISEAMVSKHAAAA
jgi:NAD(P)-dependent dehydrogenase (short-subunit alcohol dehydrogenase family)